MEEDVPEPRASWTFPWRGHYASPSPASLSLPLASHTSPHAAAGHLPGDRSQALSPINSGSLEKGGGKAREGPRTHRGLQGGALRATLVRIHRALYSSEMAPQPSDPARQRIPRSRAAELPALFHCGRGESWPSCGEGAAEGRGGGFKPSDALLSQHDTPFLLACLHPTPLQSGCSQRASCSRSLPKSYLSAEQREVCPHCWAPLCQWASTSYSGLSTWFAALLLNNFLVSFVSWPQPALLRAYS